MTKPISTFVVINWTSFGQFAYGRSAVKRSGLSNPKWWEVQTYCQPSSSFYDSVRGDRKVRSLGGIN